MNIPIFNNKKKEKPSVFKELGGYFNLGWQIAITITLMTFLGVWLDSEFDTKPVWTLICSIFGVFIAMYTFIRTVMTLTKNEKLEKEKNKKNY
jgi:ATP synthase protein I